MSQCADASRRVRELREAIARERAALPGARRLVRAAKAQAERLQEVESGLPSYLPGSVEPVRADAAEENAAPRAAPAPLADVGNVRRPAAGKAGGGKGEVGGPGGAGPRSGLSRPGLSSKKDDATSENARSAASTSAPSGAPGPDPTAHPQPSAQAPRRFVSESEFAAVPSYLKGRVTRDAVNAAIEELAARADDVARALGSDRPSHHGASAAAAGWQLLRRQHAEALRGQFWAPESHLRLKSPMEPGRQGRNMAGILRHLGRCSELRVKRTGAAGGGAAGARQEIVYVLTPAG